MLASAWGSTLHNVEAIKQFVDIFDQKAGKLQGQRRLWDGM
jgi:hypothetical protein